MNDRRLSAPRSGSSLPILLSVRCINIFRTGLSWTPRLALPAMLLPASPAAAHAFGTRYDLPLPLWFYLAGAGATVALSFALLILLGRGGRTAGDYPRIDLLGTPAGRLLAHPAVLQSIRIVSVAAFILIIVTGLFGQQSPLKNIAPTLVWVIWWVGMAFLAALVGNLWHLLSPWNSLFGWAEALWRRWRGRELARNWRYPDRLGAWPAVVLFLGFEWMELVIHDSELPAIIARAALAYSALTWGGMYLFGRATWLSHAEVFAVLFGLLGRFAPFAVPEPVPGPATNRRRLELRPYGVGLLTERAVHPSMAAFVLLILASVSLDGFMETPAWAATIDWMLSAPYLRAPLLALQSAGISLLGMAQTAALIIFPALFALVYLLFCRLMTVAGGRPEATGELARRFVFSLVPIAIAYHLAHYLSYLLVAGQLAIPLASDPFGWGWNLFDTVAYRVRLEIVDTRFMWIIAVIAIVIGHVAAVYLAHVEALRAFADGQAARRSQYPMLVLMVGYTMTSLWILAQPIVVV